MKKSIFIICCIVLHCAAIFSGTYGQVVSFFICGLLFFFGGVFLLKRNPFPNKKIGFFFIFGFFPLLNFLMFISSFFLEGFIGRPLFVVIVFSITLSFLIYKKSNQIIIYAGICFFLLLSVGTLLLPNYYNYSAQEENKIIAQDLPHLKILNENGDIVDLRKIKDKTIILDVWSSSCGICIKKFPEFEKLKIEFEKDTSIIFFTLNLPEKRDVRVNVEKYTKSYSFRKLYADEKVQKQLNIKAVPEYMIIDKEKKVRYVGSLNTGKFVFYNNFYDIIKKIK